MIGRAALAAVALAASAAVPASAANPRPATIPALREWAGGDGSFALGRRSRIVIERRQRKRLRAEAILLAADVRAVTGRTIRACVCRRRAGDIQLALSGADPRLGGEGYRLTARRTVRIAAPTAAGVFYGGRTLLQLLRQGRAIPRGTARDWPRYPERGLMLDVGRKYFTPAWLEAHVKELAYLKLNLLHLHLSDNQGWRIASESHPEVVSREHLTKSQVRRLIELASAHHIAVVPELDMPGHMQAALAQHPELQLRNALGARVATNLDYTLPAAQRFVRELVEEYLPLFPAPYFHVGADEYLNVLPIPLIATPFDYTLYPHLADYARRQHGPDATPQDGVVGFVNSLGELVRAHSKTLRVWNDGLVGARTVALHPSTIVEWWRDAEGADPAELLGQGRSILNAGWWPNYYVNGPALQPRPDVAASYERWAVNRFGGPLYTDGRRGPTPHVIDPDEQHNRGSKLLVWNDDPDAATEQEIAAGIAPRLRVIAQKTWDSPLLTPSYPEFAPIAEALGHAPGYDQTRPPG